MTEPAEAREVQAQPSDLMQTSWKEYAVRFLFGGAITVIVGVLGKAFGPVVAGLFLAFPAILPASLTLIASHDDKKAAGEDALGAAVGSIGLVAFGAIVWAGGAGLPAAATLAAASVAWFAVGVGLWFAVERFRHERRAG
jgi:uncharacterized membrane protein (GlpM family)